MARDAASMTSQRPVRLRTADGKLLSGVFIVPQAPNAVMVINPATGYRKDFYLPFAEAAAENGWAVLIYDYRGQGESARCHPRRETARMLDWARYDIPAAAEAACQAFPGLPLDIVGHSIGGQFAALIDPSLPVRRLALLSASSGYWGEQSAPLKYFAWAFWRVFGPVYLLLRGHIPKGVFWRGGPLPPRVWADWRDFGVNPECFRDAIAELGLTSRYEGFTAPVRAWTPDDDPIANPQSVRWLLERYENAQTEMKLVSHEDAGRGALGHDGLFRSKMADVFWPQVFRWLSQDAHRLARSG